MEYDELQDVGNATATASDADVLECWKYGKSYATWSQLRSLHRKRPSYLSLFSSQFTGK